MEKTVLIIGDHATQHVFHKIYKWLFLFSIMVVKNLTSGNFDKFISGGVSVVDFRLSISCCLFIFNLR